MSRARTLPVFFVGARVVASFLVSVSAFLGCDRQGGDSSSVAAPVARQPGTEAEMAAYLDAFPFDAYDVVEVPGVGSFYLDDNPALVKTTLRSGRPWEPHVLREFDEHVVSGSTVVDVGAHIGSLSIPLARLVGPEGRVYAFEPQRKIYRELVHNVRLNDLANVVPLRMAVSSEPGIVEMDPIVAHDGRVSIGKGGDVVEKRTLDSFELDDVSLIKIDVEGHEAHVLRGARQTIRAFHPALIIEIREFDEDRHEAVRLLRELGYTWRRIRDADYVAVYGGG